jgi:hypothetical protein
LLAEPPCRAEHGDDDHDKADQDVSHEEGSRKAGSKLLFDGRIFPREYAVYVAGLGQACNAG